MGHGGAGERVAAVARGAAHRCGRVAPLPLCGARRCPWETFCILEGDIFLAVRHGLGPARCTRQLRTGCSHHRDLQAGSAPDEQGLRVRRASVKRIFLNDGYEV